MIQVKNILTSVPRNSRGAGELEDVLLKFGKLEVKRVFSPRGFSTPEGQWDDQDENELVVVHNGEAELLFEDGQRIKMVRGDYINIPAHLKHRVERVYNKTIWITVFY